VPNIPIGYIGLSLGPQRSKGASKNCGTHRVNGRYVIIHIKLRQKCLNYYSCNLVLFNFPGDNAKSSNEFPWISIWRLVKPHASYCVDIPQSTLAASCVCRIVPIAACDSIKKFVAVYVWNARDQWHNWRVEGVRTAFPCQAKCKNRAPA